MVVNLRIIWATQQYPFEVKRKGWRRGGKREELESDQVKVRDGVSEKEEV